MMNMLPTKVLLASDGSKGAELASSAAVELANRTGSELHLIYVLPAPLYYHPERHGCPTQYEKQREEGQRRLDDLVERVGITGGTVAEAHLAIGPLDVEIVATAEDIGAGMIVVGSRGLGGLRRSLLGSVSESVMHHAHSPILVVRQEPGASRADVGEMSVCSTKIVVATDSSQSSAHAVREAAGLAHDTGSELHIAHVMPVSTLYSSADMVLPVGIPLYEESKQKAEGALLEDVERAEETGVMAAEAHLLEGKPDEKIVTLAEEIGAGLIVVGSRGLGALARTLVGSTSTSIVRHAHCPVMVIRDEEKNSF